MTSATSGGSGSATARPGVHEPSAAERAQFEQRLGAATAVEEAVAPRSVAGAEVVWAPMPGAQTAFLRCPFFEVLMQGTRGGGKSDSLLMSFAQHVGRGHGAAWRGVLFRRTYPELADIVAKSRKWFTRIFPEARFAKAAMTWEWPTGEALLLRHMDKPDDYWHYHGHEYPWIGFEELTTWPTPDCYLPMMSCCRTSVRNVPRMFRANTNPHGCVPYGEVLTAKRGWVPIDEILPGEHVVSVDDLGDGCVARVAAVVHQRYDGEMVVRRGRGLSMVFTTDHRLPHMSTDRTEHTLKPFHDLPGEAVVRRSMSSWDGPLPGEITGFDAGDLMEFVGWFLSEGNVLRRHGPRKAEKQLSIAQFKKTNRRLIAELLDRMDVTWRADRTGFHVSDPRLYALLGNQGYSHEKYVPRRLLGLGRRLLARLHRGLMLGDGCGDVYYTNSRRLADDVAEIAVRMGMAVYVSSRLRKNRSRRTYRVNMSPRDTVKLLTGNHVYDVSTTNSYVNVEREHFRGMVYCLTVPGTQTFFVRQDGCVWLSGNSGHGWVADRFRLLGGAWKRTVVIDDARDADGELERVRVAVPSRLSENTVLLEADPDYARGVGAAATSPAMREAWLLGSWDVVAGGMFSDVWDPRWNVVPEFEVPPGWRIDRALDWGSSVPFSVGWYAQSDGSDYVDTSGARRATRRGDVFRVGEWYGWTGQPGASGNGLKMLAVQVARGIVQREIGWGWRDRATGRSRVWAGPADTQIWTEVNGNCIAVDFMRAVKLDDGTTHRGIQWTQADKRPGTRRTGWENMRAMMGAARPDEHGTRDKPGFFVVGKQCPQFLRTVPSLPRDDVDTDDVPKKNVEDHVADEVRYRLLAAGAQFRGETTTGHF